MVRAAGRLSLRERPRAAPSPLLLSGARLHELDPFPAQSTLASRDIDGSVASQAWTQLLPSPGGARQSLFGSRGAPRREAHVRRALVSDVVMDEARLVRDGRGS